MNIAKKDKPKHLTAREYAKFYELLVGLRSFVSPECLGAFDSYIEDLKPAVKLVDHKNELSTGKRKRTNISNQKVELTEQAESVADTDTRVAIALSIASLNSLLSQYDDMIKKLELKIIELENELRAKETILLSKDTQIASLLNSNNELKQDLLKAQTSMPTKKKNTARDEEIKQLHLEGMSNRAIAQKLGISPQTVNNRIKEFFDCL